MLSVAAVLALVGCGQNEETETNKEVEKEETTLKVASLISPMTDILELVEPKLEEQGIDLEIVVLGDNVQPNSAPLQRKSMQTSSSTYRIWRNSTVTMTLI